MRALVTGCAGFIGSVLTEALLDSGLEVVGIDCFNDNYGREQKLRNLDHATEWDGFEFVPIDLARGDLQDFVDETDLVFHLAAEPGVRASWGTRFEAYMRNNVMATQHLLEALKPTPEKRLIFASSSSVYGEAERFPTPEDVTPRPFSPYGVTKLAAENLCLLYHRNHGLNAVCLRYFSVFGPRQRPDMAFHIFSRAALSGQPVTVFGDGKQTRDFTFVSDVVTATQRAAEAEGVEGLVINIGGGSQIRVNEVIDELGDLVGKALAVDYTTPIAGDVRDTCADPSRAKATLGFEPATDWRTGLRAELEWIRSLERSPQSSPSG
jgi:UDP-glucuronate 4-epimerase